MHEGEAAAPRPPYRRTCLHNPAFPLSMNGKPRASPPPTLEILRVRPARDSDSPPSFSTKGRSPPRTPSPGETHSPPLRRNAEESAPLTSTGWLGRGVIRGVVLGGRSAPPRYGFGPHRDEDGSFAPCHLTP